MSAHTPGPWILHPIFPQYVVPADHAGRRIGGAADPDEHRAYATVIHASPADPRRLSDAEAEANDRLIAAAPELLEAAKFAASALSTDCVEVEHAQAKLRAAIAKATGETA